jgi:hypothetical protein
MFRRGILIFVVFIVTAGGAWAQSPEPGTLFLYPERILSMAYCCFAYFVFLSVFPRSYVAETG